MKDEYQEDKTRFQRVSKMSAYTDNAFDMGLPKERRRRRRLDRYNVDTDTEGRESRHALRYCMRLRDAGVKDLEDGRSNRRDANWRTKAMKAA
jgi:hypothetical protein